MSRQYALLSPGGVFAPEAHAVKINGKDEVLTLAYVGGDGSRQYNTAGNASAHTFNFKLRASANFRTNGNHYQILD